MNLRTALLPLCLLAALPATAATRGFDVRDMVALDRVSSPLLSPDGRILVFAQREMDKELTKGTTGLWTRNLVTRDMAPPKRLTPITWNVNSPEFSADGQAVYFLSAKSGTQQLYSVPVTGGVPRQLTAFALDVGSYKLSPDGSHVAFSAETFVDCKSDFACTQKKLDDTKA
ncbi:MAG: DPP IV N-terminal domain-containing protein, partial [Pseudoxanthomonas sp.]